MFLINNFLRTHPPAPPPATYPPHTVEIEMMGDLSSLDHLDAELFSPKQERTASMDAAADQKEADEEGMVVGSIVSDVMFSYNHIKKHKGKFILFVSLSVALGLSLFLAMVLWGVYRSSRLNRLKDTVPRPCGGQNGRHDGGGPNASTIDAFYYSSPTSSPARAGGGNAVDIELEVGDHEVDSAFRERPPDPMVVAPVSSPREGRSPPGVMAPAPAAYYGNHGGTLPRALGGAR